MPPLNNVLEELGIHAPLLAGSVHGFAVSAEFRRNHPDRFDIIVSAFKRALQTAELQQRLDESGIGRRWTGPVESENLMRSSYDLFESYSYLFENQ